MDTQVPSNGDQPVPAPVPTSNGYDKGSAVFGVSIRAWITLIIVCCVCAISVMFAAADIKAGNEAKIGEPLYSMVLLTLGFYFGQKKLTNG